jgi:hypothetical protein
MSTEEFRGLPDLSSILLQRPVFVAHPPTSRVTIISYRSGGLITSWSPSTHQAVFVDGKLAHISLDYLLKGFTFDDVREFGSKVSSEFGLPLEWNAGEPPVGEKLNAFFDRIIVRPLSYERRGYSSRSAYLACDGFLVTVRYQPGNNFAELVFDDLEALKRGQEGLDEMDRNANREREERKQDFKP